METNFRFQERRHRGPFQKVVEIARIDAKGRLHACRNQDAGKRLKHLASHEESERDRLRDESPVRPPNEAAKLRQ